MEDIEKSRIEYVAALELQVKHLQRQLAEYKPAAEKWKPVLAGSITPEKTARFTLSFGGKRVTAELSLNEISTAATTDIVSSVVDALTESLVVDVLRAEVRPEVERIKQGAVNLLRGSTP